MTFTVTFHSKNANSTEQEIDIANDSIFEGRESFYLRIVAVRFNGQAEEYFKATDGLNKTFVKVDIEDDDCEFSTILLIIIMYYMLRTFLHHACTLLLKT